MDTLPIVYLAGLLDTLSTDAFATIVKQTCRELEHSMGMLALRFHRSMPHNCAKRPHVRFLKLLFSEDIHFRASAPTLI